VVQDRRRGVMVGVIQKSSLDLKGPFPLRTKAVDRSILLRIGSEVSERYASLTPPLIRFGNGI